MDTLYILVSALRLGHNKIIRKIPAAHTLLPNPKEVQKK